MRERQKYKDIRARLWQRRIDAYLIYPAILKVNYKGMKMSFNSAEEANEALKTSVLADDEASSVKQAGIIPARILFLCRQHPQAPLPRHLSTSEQVNQSFSLEEARKIQVATKAQDACEKWHKDRNGRKYTPSHSLSGYHVSELQMLIKVKYQGEQKYVKITDLTLDSLLTGESLLASLSSASSVVGSDSDDTIILSPTRKRQRTDEAELLIETILKKKPGGEVVLREYSKTKGLTDSTRRKMVNILVAEMTEKHGTSPPRRVREMFAEGIVSLFPYLKDPYSEKGYEHYFDPKSGDGYLAYRIKTVQRNSSSSEKRPTPEYSGGPTAERETVSSTLVLSEDQYREAISLMKHSSDEETIKQKMKLTFAYRKKMIQDPVKCSTILSEFPRFLDVKGLIEQDFVQLFGEETSAKFLEKWPTIFKQKIIQLSKSLTSKREELLELIEMAESTVAGADTDADGWDSDLSSILLLLHLIPPTRGEGRKRAGHMAASQAENLLVKFLKAGTSIQQHLDAIEQSKQPYLLAVGSRKSDIHVYYIVLDKRALPCKSVSAVGAFDEMFKAHFVFGVAYNTSLHSMYTFVQTTVYNVDIGKVKETPRVAELRTKILQ
ncbi:uncharacterized protein LOC131961112 [Centropristis striata]|uniref:uncharacterized protein LOC131961112 n=1 Tax=Centropristis striata TaxID=184440 RepID=UPI0027DF93B6|nr:uncharacterized protein LOC131961112 [Centropristis striata]